MSIKYNTTLRKKDNGWQVIVSYKTSSGKWRQKSKQGFDEKWKAKNYGNDLIEQIKKEPELNTDYKGITLKQFTDIYKSDNKDRLTYNTLQTIDNAVKFVDDIADLPLQNITSLQLSQKFTASNSSTATKILYQTLIKTILGHAIKPYNIIANNPLEDIKIKKSKTKKYSKYILTPKLIYYYQI